MVHARENRLYKSYLELVRWIPSLRSIPHTDLRDALQHVRDLFLWLVQSDSSGFSLDKALTAVVLTILGG